MANNEHLENITGEIDKAVQVATKHPIYGRFLAPLRLLVVWVKSVNAELREIRASIERNEKQAVTIEHGEG
ncbi:hypothetical protein O1O06_11830 [Grimontia hollisae]|uniref:hypothetical protein n=1 Tax=Grimontia hollisae TaxID=673 RepID=UPI0023DB40F2|nr:hypothetical protein [Grimontia hollisae]MDF2185452.1 hypothetical protein [Grimontia hollisae]